MTFLRNLRLAAGSLLFRFLISLGIWPQSQECDHPDAGEDEP